MKTISKVVVYYSDGTYQEVFGSNPYLPTPPVYPFMPPSYPPSVPPTWTSPFTYGINEVKCGTGWGVVTTSHNGAGTSKVHNGGAGKNKD